MTATHETFVKQLDGSPLGGSNCTCGAAGSLCYRHTLGRKRFSAATIRRATGDFSGGTNLDQMKAALARLGVTGFYGPFRGQALSTFYALLRTGRGAIVQGGSSATRATIYRASFTFGGNHAWYIARGEGWRLVNGVMKPDYLIVYDPLADGRYSGIARSPFRLPRSLFEKFVARLLIGSTYLGAGRVYSLFSRDTVPHGHYRHGGRATSPQPRRFRLKGGYKWRGAPGGSFIRATRTGEIFDAYQVASGPVLSDGSGTYYGSHSGGSWVHSSAIAA